MSPFGAAVSWHSEYAPRAIRKPGRVVHQADMIWGVPPFPVVGEVRGIFLDDRGQWCVRASFPYNRGATTTLFAHEVRGDFPPELIGQGSPDELERYCRQREEGRDRAGVPDPPGYVRPAA